MPPPPLTLAPAAAAPRGDFADWLSPMLVKELRQGLKTKVFVSTFIIIQCAMVLLLSFQLLDQSGSNTNNNGGLLDGLLYVSLAGALLFLLPARGLGVISAETKANTLDLVQLTGLGATRIVWGKWVALVCQTLLLVVSVLPYALLRYFFGGVEVVAQMGLLYSLISSSLVLTAATVLLSTLPLGTRVVVVLVAVPGMFILASASAVLFTIGNTVTRTYMGISPGAMLMVSAFLLLLSAVMNVWFFLSVAASYIARDHRNYAARKRLIALGTVLIGVLLALIDTGNDLAPAWLVSTSMVWGVSLLDALAEKTSEVPSLYQPPQRFGFMLYPGWASGLSFTILMVALVSLILALGERPWNAKDIHTCTFGPIYGLLAVLAPLLVLVPFPSLKQRGGWYLLLQLGMVVWCGLCNLLGSGSTMSDTVVDMLQGLTPTSAFLYFMMNSNDEPYIHASMNMTLLPIGLFLLVLLLGKASIEFKLIRRMEAESPEA